MVMPKLPSPSDLQGIGENWDDPEDPVAVSDDGGTMDVGRLVGTLAWLAFPVETWVGVDVDHSSLDVN